jgi:Ni2+-binding GTPase involved in maturation of urease and hydrogenase
VVLHFHVLLLGAAVEMAERVYPQQVWLSAWAVAAGLCEEVAAEVCAELPLAVETVDLLFLDAAGTEVFRLAPEVSETCLHVL